MAKPLRLHFVSIDSAIKDERDFYIQCIAVPNDLLTPCDNPEEADWIIVTDFSIPHQFGLVHHLPAVANFPEKSVIITECDQPVEILPGLYSSGRNSCSLSRFIDGWHYPYLNKRFPNQQILLSNDDRAFEKSHLATFVGYPSHIIRHRLMKLFGQYPDMDITVTKEYHHFAVNDDLASEAAQKRYVDMIQKSHFSICPRGRGPSSMRLFDSMRFGVAPVIISDEWIQPSFVNWESCSLRVKEKHLPELHKILLENKGRSREMGQNARKVYEGNFAADSLPKSLRSSLDQLQLSLATPPKVSPCFIRRTRLSRFISFKSAFYKAILFNRLNKG